MTPPLTFVLPLPPSKANARQHWRVALKAKKDYWAQLDALDVQCLLPDRPRAPFARAEISIRMFVHSIFDTDNAVANCKPLLDFLVSRRYIASDKPSALVYAGMPTQVIDRKNPRIEITLSPIEDAA